MPKTVLLGGKAGDISALIEFLTLDDVNCDLDGIKTVADSLSNSAQILRSLAAIAELHFEKNKKDN